MADMTLCEYLTQHPDWKPTEVSLMRYSSGIMLLITLDGVGHFRWDAIKTPTFYKHYRKDSTEVFFDWLRKYMVKHSTKSGFPTTTFFKST